ncbi:hypothetical protein ACFSTC_23980 [Nonomuraea ferruginea]
MSTGEQDITVLLFDGLGHGPAAAHASREAVELFLERLADEPLAILRRLHDGLAHTRGGAAAVARVTPARVSYAGLGNISGWITHADDRQGMVSVPGITGHQRRRLRAVRVRTGRARDGRAALRRAHGPVVAHHHAGPVLPLPRRDRRRAAPRRGQPSGTTPA